MTRTMPGNCLTPDDQKHALASFVHRFTGEHKPAWVNQLPRPDGTPYKVQFRDDAEWLTLTDFYVTKTGRLDGRKHECVSHPSWPEGRNE